MLKTIEILKFIPLGILLSVSIECMEVPVSIECIDEEKSQRDTIEERTDKFGPIPYESSDLSLLSKQSTPIADQDSCTEIELLRSELEKLHLTKEQEIDALRTELETFRASMSVIITPAISYQVLELSLQYLFYKYCDQEPYAKESWKPVGETNKFWEPEEEAARLRVSGEETINLAYSQLNPTPAAFSPHPVRENLKNTVGPEVEQWLKNKEKEISDIKAAWLDLKTWEGSKPSYTYPADRLERHVKEKEFFYNSLIRNYARKHCTTLKKDLEYGQTEPTKTEIEDLEFKILPNAAEINDIQAAWKVLETWKKSEPGYYGVVYYSKEYIEKTVSEKESAYYALVRQFVGKYGPKEVRLGEREATEAEITALELKIRSNTPTVFITQASGLGKPAVGTPYTSLGRPEIVKGFTILEKELPRYCEALEKIFNISQKRYDILTDVWTMYQNDFLGSDLGLMKDIKSEAQKVRKNKIKPEIEKKYPPPVAPKRLSDKDLIIKLDTIRDRIKKLSSRTSELTTTNEDERFSKVYMGLDEHEETMEASQIKKRSHIDAYLDNSNKEVNFANITSRRYLNDEGYDIQMMWKDPSKNSLEKLGTNKIGLFLRDSDLYCTLQGVVLKLTLNMSDVHTKSLKTAVEQNTAPSLEDRRNLLDFLKENTLVNKIEIFKEPRGVQMIIKFPAINEVMAHRQAWNEKQEISNITEPLSVFDQIKKGVVLKETFAPDINYKQREKYNELLQKFAALLYGDNLHVSYVQLLLNLYKPAKERKTRIPRGWKFAISEDYEEVDSPESKLKTLDTSKGMG